MAIARTFLPQFTRSPNVAAICKLEHLRCYSIYPQSYVKPTFRKDEQEELFNSDKLQALKVTNIRPTESDQNSSEFYDAKIKKFTNYIMRKGNKMLARDLLEKTFENIKRIQIEHYNKAKDDEKEFIELNPKVIFYQALKNCKPVLELTPMKVAGSTYQVPIPVSEHRAEFLAMNWLIQAGKTKERTVHLPEKLAYELLDAAYNKGSVVQRKHELHKQCEVNRAYAHYRWI